MIKTFTKDPNSVLDYTINWKRWLGPHDTISTSAWAIDSGAGLTIDSNTKSNSTATVWLSAGTEGTTYTVRNRIVTTQGRTEDRSFLVVVKTR